MSRLTSTWFQNKTWQWTTSAVVAAGICFVFYTAAEEGRPAREYYEAQQAARRATAQAQDLCGQPSTSKVLGKDGKMVASEVHTEKVGCDIERGSEALLIAF